jgi:CheY-like chemotaxis protein
MADGDLAGLRVLIVEDHADSAEMLSQLLQHLGSDTRAVATAEPALEFVRTFRPHVILLDLHIPGVHDGRWLLDRIRALQGPLGTVPIFATTGERALPTADVQGFSVVLEKPLDLDRLTSLLQALVADRRRDD